MEPPANGIRIRATLYIPCDKDIKSVCEAIGQAAASILSACGWPAKSLQTCSVVGDEDGNPVGVVQVQGVDSRNDWTEFDEAMLALAIAQIVRHKDKLQVREILLGKKGDHPSPN